MRTTLTLDPDVAAALDRMRSSGERTFKQAVNDVLRAGIRALAQPVGDAEPYQTRPVSLGGCLIGSLEDVADALALAEGEDFR